jgi:4-alpha-glucanotransferase
MERCSGILLHITSLPSPHPVGDLGPAAFEFADFLASAKQRVWQVLPLNPTDGAHGNSPYSSVSAFAGNALLISPERLVEDGLLRADDLPSPVEPRARCDYDAAAAEKQRLLARAFDRFRATGRLRAEYEGFASINAHWLDDYALFVVLKRRLGGAVWNRWPEDLRNRREEALREARAENAIEIERETFVQFLFFRQWMALKARCNGAGVRLLGDIPIYVSYDSADVWRDGGIFKLDSAKEPRFVAGVPPDYFSETGQLWGNPVYDWDVLRATRYRWWMERFAHNLGLFDIVRVDHFRGFVGYWEVPAGERTAVKGRWVKAPADDFFEALRGRFPALPIVAEDLGVITPDVKEVMARFEIPGMRVLLFAFGEDDPAHPYLPHNYVPNCLAYTGTHDNNTVRGWFEAEALPEERARLARYFKAGFSARNVHIGLVRYLLMSIAGTVVVPMQDVLGLGAEARMNRPAVPHGNWEWRLLPGQAHPRVADALAAMVETYGRAGVFPAAASTDVERSGP